MRILFTIVCAVCISLTVAAQKKDISAIQASFGKYKTAVLNDRGEEALKYVDSRTIVYYAKISEAVKNADSTDLEKLSLIDKMTVLLFRHRAPAEQLLSYDGEGLFVYAIGEGMVSKNSVASSSLKKITIDDNFAKAQFVSDGEPTPYYFHFYKENGAWRLDLTSLIKIGALAIEQLVAQSDMEENEFILFVIGLTNGTEPSGDIWEPLQP